MALIKIATTLFIQWRFWESVKNLVLSPFNATIELILFMLVIPFFVNLLIFWVTDNFLMRHDHQQHKRSFLINYVSKINKNPSNGFTNGTAPATNGNASIQTNGKLTTRNLYERAKEYCTSRLVDIDNFSTFNQIDKQRRFNELIDNDSESDALLSGDERFDVEFTDDDCVALEPRDPRLNSWNHSIHHLNTTTITQSHIIYAYTQNLWCTHLMIVLSLIHHQLTSHHQSTSKQS